MAAFHPPELDLALFPIPTQPFINGKAVDSTADDKHTLISSLNDAVITRELQWSSVQDVEAAVEAAECGLTAWNALSKEQRWESMAKFAALIRENKERLHWLGAVLTGKDSTFGGFEIGFVADAFDYYAGMVGTVGSEVIEHHESIIAYTLRQPWGITAGIVPFNAPLLSLAQKVALALVGGKNTHVQKVDLTQEER